MGNAPEVDERLVLEDTPCGETLEELTRGETELLFPPEEEATPDELRPGGTPDGKGGLDMIRNLLFELIMIDNPLIRYSGNRYQVRIS